MTVEGAGKETKKLLLIILLGLAIRVFATIHFQSQSASLNYFGYDESVYYSLAKHMAESNPFSYTLKGAPLYFQDYVMWYVKKPLFHHPPLYVWILYLWQQIFGNGVLISRFLNVMLGTLTIYIAYLIGRRLSESVGLLSAFFVSISALNVQQSGLILMDTLLVLLTALFILFVMLLSEKNTPLNLALCGVILGLNMWTKYFGMLAVSFLIVYTINEKISTKQTAQVVGVALLMFSPWLIWNYRVYGSLIPIKTWSALASWPQVVVPFYAYVTFLPVVAPFALLGYAGLFRIKKHPLKMGLAAVFLSFLLVFSFPKSKEMRFILPAVVPLSVLAGDFIENSAERYKNPLLFLVIIATAIASYVIVEGGYFWYLPFWHYGDWFKLFHL